MNESAVNTVATTAEAEGTNLMETMRAYFSDYQTWLTEVAVFGGIAFLVGFLVKNFGRYVIGTILIAILAIIALNYAGITTFTLQQAGEMVGITGIGTVQELYTSVVTWSTTHVIGAVSVVVGFLLGWKLG